MIDTLKFAKTFESAGFAKPQAEAIVVALAAAVSREDLVTKSDLKVAVAELRVKIYTGRSQIVWAMFGSQFLLLGLLTALGRFTSLFH